MPSVELYHGDNLDIFPLIEDESVDTVITDPPYGLKFMGKEWDTFPTRDRGERLTGSGNPTDARGFGGNVAYGKTVVEARQYQEWCIRWAAECLRVSKPGAMLCAFGGTRTHHRLMCAIEDAGWEIRDVLMWLYGCLSEDTEILTADGWKTYGMLFDGCAVMGYNVDKDKLEWQQVQEVYTYAYEDTAYRIQSDCTDQLVSRNHRCLVERGGRYVFRYAETLERQETVPVLESVPGLPFRVPVRDKRAGDQEQDVLKAMPWGADKQNQNGTTAQAARDVDMQEMPHGVRAQERQGNQVLQSGMLRAMALREPRDTEAFGRDCQPWARWMDRREQGQRQEKDERPEQSSLEGWRYLFQDTRQLPGRQVCTMPSSILADGAQGQLRDGASADCGAAGGALPETLRGCASQRPRPNEQQPGQLDAIQQQHSTQEIRGEGATCPTLATVTPVHYNGIVWCVRVPTGAFVARRNGHVFVTGNSGFPKSHDVSKAIDKAAGAERGTTPDYRNGPNTNPMSKGDKYSGGYLNQDNGSTLDKGPATDAAALWDGYGTALKPAYEPIILAMKPLPGTFAQNALEYGVAGLAIDKCRVGTSKDGDPMRFVGCNKSNGRTYAQDEWTKTQFVGKPINNNQGRWPANLLLSHAPGCERVGVRKVKGDKRGSNGGIIPRQPPGKHGIYGTYNGGNDNTPAYGGPDGTETVEAWNCVPDCPVRLLDEQSGERSGGHFPVRQTNSHTGGNGIYGHFSQNLSPPRDMADTGGASRFFTRFHYSAKASRAERELGLLGHIPCLKCGELDSVTHLNPKTGKEEKCRRNGHPTVKPLDVCRWLCRLTRTPTGGVVLDPFMGSGRIPMAAILEGRDTIGIELERPSFEIAEAAVAWAEEQVLDMVQGELEYA